MHARIKAAVNSIRLSIISPITCREWLHRWIETIPCNKILFFGGDYRFAEGAYSHSVIARHIVTETLTEKVTEGYLSEDEADNVYITPFSNHVSVYDPAGKRIDEIPTPARPSNLCFG